MTNLFAPYYFTFPSSSFAVISILLKDFGETGTTGESAPANFL